MSMQTECGNRVRAEIQRKRVQDVLPLFLPRKSKRHAIVVERLNLARLSLEQLECRCLLANTSVSIADAQVTEGRDGTSDMTFAITRTGDLSSELQVYFETSTGTATERDDFTLLRRTISLQPGKETTDVTVRVKGDVAAEPNESLSARITPVAGPVYRINAEQPYGLMTDDFNGDGRIDLAATRLVPDGRGSLASVLMLLNESSGQGAPFGLPFGKIADLSLVGNDIQFQTQFGAAADLNGDGRPDLAVPNTGTSTDNFAGREICVLLNDTATGQTTANFTQNTNLSMDMSPDAVAIGDLNGDGLPDLVATVTGTNENPGTAVSVFLNETTTGALTPAFRPKQDFAVEIRPWHVALGDINSDGRLDIVTPNYGTAVPNSGVSVLLNETSPGSSTLSFSAMSRFETGARPSWVVIEDLNADGKPDIVTPNRVGNNISVLMNTTVSGATTPSFATNVEFPSPGTPTNLSVLDYDGDRRPDIAVLDRDSSDVRVFLNKTSKGSETPVLTPLPPIRANSGPRSIVSGDFNGDGQPELATASPLDDTIAVYFQPSFEITDGEAIGTIIDDDGPAPIGDLNDDRVVNASDIDALFAAIHIGNKEGKFDLNKDSRVDNADVDELVGKILGTGYGDANLDGVFDSSDLVSIFQAGQYEDAIVGNSRWSTGDWDGDLEFTTSDLIVAFQSGAYRG